MNVRMLTAADVALFQPVRLRALREHPEAFGSSYEEEKEVALDKVPQSWNTTTNVIFGAFDGEQLVGICHLGRLLRVKTAHRANFGAMYVAPEARGLGVGRALLDTAINHARTLEGLEDVVLSVTVGNDSARQLYISAGFKPYGFDPRYIKLGDQYFDIELMILKVN